MTPEIVAMLAIAVLVIAFLYSCVGHAGASGYIAVMTLFSMAPGEIKPTALALNILVASIGTWQFWRAGHFSWRLFWPFAALSIPFAFLGGYLNLPTHFFKTLVGIVLLFSAARFLLRPPEEQEPLVVSVDAAGKLYLNIADDPNQPITGEDLKQRVAAVLRRDQNRSVLVRGDHAADYGSVVAAMVLLQQAGVPNVGLVTESPEGE